MTSRNAEGHRDEQRGQEDLHAEALCSGAFRVGRPLVPDRVEDGVKGRGRRDGAGELGGDVRGDPSPGEN